MSKETKYSFGKVVELKVWSQFRSVIMVGERGSVVASEVEPNRVTGLTRGPQVGRRGMLDQSHARVPLGKVFSGTIGCNWLQGGDRRSGVPPVTTSLL